MSRTTQTDHLESEALFARRVVRRLAQGEQELPHDVTERLRAARVRATEMHKSVLAQTARAAYAQNSILTASHGDHPHWWQRLGAIGLLLVLIVGLYTISEIQADQGARELADIDAALLTDDLPPSAYLDSGFVQYLKVSNRQDH